MGVRTILFYKEGTGTPFIGHVIEHEGKSWLVPEWNRGPTQGTSCPARIVCLDGLPLSKPGTQYDVDLALAVPLHRDILEGRRVSQSPLVIERPEIFLREDTDFFRG